MKIGGIQKNSFVDYPGKIAAVIFTVGCNMNCFFCHNKRLLRVFPPEEMLSEEEVLAFLAKRTDMLDGVVISGGEPLLQKDIGEFIQKVKALGYPVKLDTNGSWPERLAQVIDLVDFVAMDIKAPFERYPEFSGLPDVTGKVRESMRIIVESGKDYQFRTTMAPGLTEADAEIIRGYCPDPSKYITQKYRKPED